MFYAAGANPDHICYHFIEGVSKKEASITFGFMEEVPHCAIHAPGATDGPIPIPIGAMLAVLTEASGGVEKLTALAQALDEPSVPICSDCVSKMGGACGEPDFEWHHTMDEPCGAADCETFSVGDKILFHQQWDIFPWAIVKAGESGTITAVHPDGMLSIKLNHHHPDLREWKTHVYISPSEGSDGWVGDGYTVLDYLCMEEGSREMRAEPNKSMCAKTPSGA